MSFVRLSGGLGNQLFQYSFAQSLQKIVKENSVFDLIEYKFPSSKSAHRLGIIKIVDSNCINRPLLRNTQLPSKASNALNQRNRSKLNKNAPYGLKLIRENDLVYDRNLEIIPNGYYVGNFISHQYWGGDEDQIIDLVREKLENISRSKTELYSNSIGVHVRRGDYISNKKTLKFHGYCSDLYYLNAVKQSLETFPQIKSVSVASDSIETLTDLKREIENLGVTVKFITEKDPILALLALAAHDIFVGSNSTFSWWAAALTSKRVSFFPEDWFASGDFGYSPDTYFPFSVETIPNALRVF